MKQSNTTYTDQNWSWPQSTWFQKRLSAIKAQEEANRQKNPGTPAKPVAADTKPSRVDSSKEL
jgi:hypothetical protein